MKWLAIDTSTLVLSVAVVEESRVLGETTTNLHKNHSVRLMPTVASLLQELALLPRDIEGVAVAGGPGSYTGVRIGFTTAKTFAWARGIPLYKVSSLAVLAMNGFRFAGGIVPLFDARRERVYTGLYRGEESELRSLFPERVHGLKNWLRELKERGPLLFLGEDVHRFKPQIIEMLGSAAVFGTSAENTSRASSVGQLAMEKWKKGCPGEAEDTAPEYLQLAEAEAKWLQSQADRRKPDGLSAP